MEPNKSLQLTPGGPCGSVSSVPLNGGCVASFDGATELYVMFSWLGVEIGRCHA
jgi:hypothetical protein